MFIIRGDKRVAPKIPNNSLRPKGAISGISILFLYLTLFGIFHFSSRLDFLVIKHQPACQTLNQHQRNLTELAAKESEEGIGIGIEDFRVRVCVLQIFFSGRVGILP